ncbi:MAG: hypothetical protein KGY69_19305 [Bacteroidales bacterium]|nr:hypothetical protein [Candidatus Cloacimonadota bacterium]MBS3772407.1 hypothetical protein [Bacteroidales bacterium]
MNKSDLKREINKVMDEISESELENILEYLKEIKDSSPEKTNLSKNLGKIIREDKELLKRLAS